MSDKTGIEWTEATWNPVTGCSKVSQGCKHCYAERDWARLSAPRPTPNIYTGRAFTDVRCHPERLDQPFRWSKPRRIFVNSMSDLFHENVPDSFIKEVFRVMATEAHHTFQVLTKRAKRMRDLLIRWREDGTFRYHDDMAPASIWLGVSVEDQAAADYRIPLLLRTPAAVRWISAEPLLGPINLVEAFDSEPSLDWIVAGGESGTHARPMHPDWVRSLRDQCATAGVPFLFKQWGEYAEDRQHGKATGLSGPIRACRFDDGTLVERIGKKAAGRHLDGKLHDEYPSP